MHIIKFRIIQNKFRRAEKNHQEYVGQFFSPTRKALTKERMKRIRELEYEMTKAKENLIGFLRS